MRFMLPLVLAFVGLGSGAHAESTPFGTSWGGQDKLLLHADLNDDGKHEILVTGQSVSHMRILDPLTGATRYDVPEAYGLGDDLSVLAGDFDPTDAAAELALLRINGLNRVLGIIEWNGSAFVEKWRVTFQAIGGAGALTGAGSFLGAGGGHHLLVSETAGFALVRVGDGTIEYNWLIDHPGFSVAGKEILDIDGDGRDEVLVSSSGGFHVVRALAAVGAESPVFTSRPTAPRNAPNPFRRSTEITFGLARQEHVTVRIFDSGGRLVRTVLDRTLEPGTQRISWDGTDRSDRSVASGVYFYEIAVAGERQARKMLRVE